MLRIIPRVGMLDGKLVLACTYCNAAVDYPGHPRSVESTICPGCGAEWHVGASYAPKKEAVDEQDLHRDEEG